MKPKLKSIIGFGMLGAIIGGVLGNVIFGGISLSTFFYGSGVGFFIGGMFGLVLLRITKMTDEDFAKGLAYECPTCKGTVYKTESNCSKCGHKMEWRRS